MLDRGDGPRQVDNNLDLTVVGYCKNKWDHRWWWPYGQRSLGRSNWPINYLHRPIGHQSQTKNLRSSTKKVTRIGRNTKTAPTSFLKSWLWTTRPLQIKRQLQSNCALYRNILFFWPWLHKQTTSVLTRSSCPSRANFQGEITRLLYLRGHHLMQLLVPLWAGKKGKDALPGIKRP